MHNTSNKGPHFNMIMQGPLPPLERLLLDKKASIESWLNQQFNVTPPPIYCSVDLRNSGFKIAPVDTNLFPAGFNLVDEKSLPLSLKAIQANLALYGNTIKSILLIPEDHTRNILYYENIATISDLFIKAGFEVKVGSLLPDIVEPTGISLPSGKSLTLEPIERRGHHVMIKTFVPDIILLNNDLSSGLPAILRELQQPILPPLHAGWYTRKKSRHFEHYKKVVTEFCNLYEIDPWLISPLFHYCGAVNFMVKGGEHCILEQANNLFKEIREKYQAYKINQEPFLVVKADSGTYGLSVMMIKDPQELNRLNRKERTRMSTIKGGREVRQVIIQEGIPTAETYGEQRITAEPVMYMLDKEVVGAFYRVHSNKGNTENLNSPGMSFEPLSFFNSELSDGKFEASDRFYAYGVIARLALVAAARELLGEAISDD